MIVRLGVGLIFAASIAVYVLAQMASKSSADDDGESSDSSCNEVEAKTHVCGLKDVIANEEEEDEVLKHVSRVISPSLSDRPHFEEGDDLLPESENPLPGKIESSLPDNNHDTPAFKTEEEKMHENDMEKTRYELERLRSLVREMEERQAMLEGELLESYGLKEQESSFSELKKQLMIKTVEIDMLKGTVNSLQADRKRLQEEVSLGASAKKELENARKKIKELQRQIHLESMQAKHQVLLLKQQVIGLQVKEEEAVRKDADVEKMLRAAKESEVEVMELKRKNKELQHEKRELIFKLDAAEANVNALSNLAETGSVAKMREEANALRQTNEDLIKQVEGLQMNRFSEVEDLVYLRWVNACLRFELRNHRTSPGKISAALDLSKSLSPRSRERAKQLMLEYAVSEHGDADLGSNFDDSSLDGNGFDDTSINSKFSKLGTKRCGFFRKLKKWGKSKDDSSLLSSPGSSFNASPRSVSMRIQRPKGPLETLMLGNEGDDASITSFGTADENSNESDSRNVSKLQLAPIEKRPYRTPSPPPKPDYSGGSHETAATQPPRGPPHPPPQVKDGMEAQGDSVQFLASEVRAASFASADELVQFVNWLDEELSFLTDERAVLKHFDWPEAKADALRKASFEYQDLAELEKQVSSSHDDRTLNCESALDNMYKLLEKVEQSVYALLSTRDVLVSRYREFGIPVEWLLDSGLVGKIKLGSVRLARDYMKRVLFELDGTSEPEKEPKKEFLILQGVRFAFRVHQFAGGFDADSMEAFEELRSRATSATQNINKKNK